MICFSSAGPAGPFPPGTARNLICICMLQLVMYAGSLLAQKTSEQELYGGNQALEQLERDLRGLYGADQVLINGVEYYNEHARSKGHKFYGEDRYQRGRLVIEHKVYDDVLLKYDIYNQQVLMLSSQGSARDREIIINGLWLKEFSLGNRVFRKYYFPGRDTLLYQVYKGSYIDFLVHWSWIIG